MPQTTSENEIEPRDPQLARRILAVMPTLNEATAIDRAVESLLAGDDLAPIQFIVADGGSTDGTRAKLDALAARYPNLSWIDNPAGDQSNGVNAGAQAGDPDRDILIRCDAHALYPPGFLLGVARRLIETGADSLVIPMDAATPSGANAFQRANAFIVDTPLGSGGSAHRGGQTAGWIDHGHHAGFRRDRFIALGGYDPSMVGNEDAEYDTRLALAGGSIYIEPSLRIRYFPRATPGSLFDQYRRYGSGRARHLSQHRKWPRLRQMAPVLHVMALAVSISALGVTRWALSYPAAYIMMLVGVALWAMIRTRDVSMFRSGIALALMHTGWGLGFLAETLRRWTKP